MDTDKAVNFDKLTRDQLRVLRDRGTELPFSRALLKNRETGDYTCAACGARLFESGAKYPIR
jgi:peptide-methionine (R)-S-oxide reductase